MKSKLINIYFLRLTVLVSVFIFSGAPQALAGCSASGPVIFDAAQSSYAGGGTVWSNSVFALNGEQDAYRAEVKTADLVTIVNTDTSGDGNLVEDATERSDTTAKFTDLDAQNAGQVSQLDYFSNPDAQLFDFNRYKAAAIATSNRLSWSEFKARVVAGETLYGITFVDVPGAYSASESNYLTDPTDVSENLSSSYSHPDVKANGNKIEWCHDACTGDGKSNMSGKSINAQGTIVFNMANTANDFKIVLKIPINVNPATGPNSGSTSMTAADFITMSAAAQAQTANSKYDWPSGYSDAWTTGTGTVATSGKDPRGVALSGGYSSFTNQEDMPALMYSSGIVDTHGAANISGVVYTPHFIELEQKNGSCSGDYACVQFVNGALIAGTGYKMEGCADGWGLAVVFDPDTVDFLGVMPTLATMGKKSLKVVN